MITHFFISIKCVYLYQYKSKTSTFMLFNCRTSKRFGMCTIYAGAKNIFSYIQDEKHTDDAAFMYAPVYGATWYVGLSVKL